MTIFETEALIILKLFSIIGFILVGLHPVFATGDSLKLDSLYKKVKVVKNKSEKAKIYLELGIYFEGLDYAKAINYCDSAKLFLDEEKDQQILAECYVTLGNVYWYIGENKKAMENYLLALKIREKLKDNRGIGVVIFNISLLHDAFGNTEESIQHAKEALRYFQLAKNKNMQAEVYMQIANIYDYENDSINDRKYFKLAESIFNELTDHHTISVFYMKKGAYFKKVNLDSTLYYYFKAMQHDSIIGNLYNYTSTLNNIGMLYYQYGNLDKAISYTKKSLEISESNDLKMSRSYSYGNLATFYHDKGDYKSAYDYYNRYYELKRELNDEDNKRITNEMEARFQDEKKQLIIDRQEQESMAKDAKIEKQDEENKRINQQRIFIGAGLGLMIIITILIFRSLQRKKRDNALIRAQKDEIIHQKEELQEKHTEIKDSIDYAKRIQTALLTSDEYWNEISSDHFILFQPKDVVSGDFFWAFQTDTPNGKLAIWCAADCTGHGVPGAFMSMLGISFLNEIVVERGIYDAKDILLHLRDRIIKALIQKKGEIKQRDGMDIALCVWNKNTNVLEFAGANNPLWIVRQEAKAISQQGEEWNSSLLPPALLPFALLEIKPSKIPVGQFGDDLEDFTKSIIPLKKGDMIYSFSDGFADQFGGPNGKKLRYANFKNMLLEIADLQGTEQKTILAQKFKDWKGNLEQIDDVCVIGIRIN